MKIVKFAGIHREASVKNAPVPFQRWSMGILSVLIAMSCSLSEGALCLYKTAKCSCVLTTAVCEDLTEVPELIDELNNPNLTTVLFNGGNLASIPALPPGITSVEFNDVPLTNFSTPDASVASLRLNITKASFERLPEAFKNFKNLTSLIISNTPIEDLDNDVMASLAGSLTSLTLRGVNMSQWPYGLSQLKILKNLTIRESPLFSIPDDAFTSFADSLSSLSLEALNLTTLSPLSALGNLTTLSLSDSTLGDAKTEIEQILSFPMANTLNSLLATSVGLTELPNLANFSSLKSITLDHNSISNLDIASLPLTLNTFSCAYCLISSVPLQMKSLINLISIDFRQNKFKTLNIDSFSASVSILHLENNHLSEITGSGFSTSLEELYLSYNFLSDIPACIRNLSKLYALFITDNQLTEISFDSISPNITSLILSNNNITSILSSNSTTPSLLTTLYLNNNPIVNIDPKAFINLGHLVTLYMANTKLVGIPLALSSLKALQILLTDYLLACPCPADQELVQWYQSRKGFLVMAGSCKAFVKIQDYLTDFCDRTQISSTVLPGMTTTPRNSGLILGHCFIFTWFMFIKVILYVIMSLHKYSI